MPDSGHCSISQAAVAAGQFTNYKLDFRSSLRGAVLQVLLLLQLLILLVVANGAAVAAKKLLRGHLPDHSTGGALFVDGRPVFGPTKTIRRRLPA